MTKRLAFYDSLRLSFGSPLSYPPLQALHSHSDIAGIFPRSLSLLVILLPRHPGKTLLIPQKCKLDAGLLSEQNRFHFIISMMPVLFIPAGSYRVNSSLHPEIYSKLLLAISRRDVLNEMTK